MIAGLLLALISAALINIGFLAQHRGLHTSPAGGALTVARAAITSPVWLAGQALGWVGFAIQIAAVAIAPLSLVQAFAAGGLALSVPFGALIFGQRLTRAALLAVLLIAASLAVLPLGLPAVADRLAAPRLVAVTAVCVVIGPLLLRLRPAWTKAIAAGIFYGVADAAIKAVSVDWKGHGAAALLSGWTALAAFATFAGFLAFQTALRRGDGVTAITLMTAFAALVALVCGLLAFGESLGSSAGVVVAHVLAIAVVLGCVPVLAAAQSELAAPDMDGDKGGPAGAEAQPAS